LTTKTRPAVKPETAPQVTPQREPAFEPERWCPKQIEKVAP
jgi:hypothetical protein